MDRRPRHNGKGKGNPCRKTRGSGLCGKRCPAPLPLYCKSVNFPNFVYKSSAMKKSILTPVLSAFVLSLLAQPASWSPRGIGGGGALFSPSINPGNTSEYYISCDMSELFHTTNFGLGYTQVHFNEFIGGHNSKVCYTTSSNLLYSIRYLNDIGTPAVSTDNGATWNSFPGNP